MRGEIVIQWLKCFYSCGNLVARDDSEDPERKVCVLLSPYGDSLSLIFLYQDYEMEVNAWSIDAGVWKDGRHWPLWLTQDISIRHLVGSDDICQRLQEDLQISCNSRLAILKSSLAQTSLVKELQQMCLEFLVSEFFPRRYMHCLQ